MVVEPVTRDEDGARGIKLVPPEALVREDIARLAAELMADLDRAEPPSRDTLEQLGRTVLDYLGLPEAYLGFAMVMAHNAYWRDAFQAVPYTRRLLLLPHCLRDQQSCAGTLDTIGLHCAHCGACGINDLRQEAEALGYRIVVAEGVSAVLAMVLAGEADAILGVACLDSLEKSFARIAELGVPNMAAPLLTDGCLHTQPDWDALRAILAINSDIGDTRTRSYLPLLRATQGTFTEESLLPPPDPADPLAATAAIAHDWLAHGGKRFRPFITLAAYAVGRHGLAALAPDAVVDDMLPPAVRRLAIAIEAMHKASLVHDDIEDNDAQRYGRPTVYRQHGLAPAVNVGDYLVGYGYRLIAGEQQALGAACVADLLARLASAHLDLCRGQGAELQWPADRPCKPVDVLSIYALKTAPAFEAALYIGLRAADAPIDQALLKRFTVYLGEGYQVHDDVREWLGDATETDRLAQELRANRPTLLRAFAVEAGAATRLAEIALLAATDPIQAVADARALYTTTGAITNALRLRDRLRQRAQELADTITPPELAHLFAFLVRVVLAEG